MLWAIAVVVALVAAYVVLVRPWLCRQAWARTLFAAIEPIELRLWKKSETILWARFKQVLAVLFAALPQIGAIDVTPYLAVIPQKHHWWVMLIPSAALSIDGLIGEWLRRTTTKPLELVAIPEKVDPAVAEAVTEVEIANKMAVEVVKEAQNVGTAA